MFIRQLPAVLTLTLALTLANMSSDHGHSGCDCMEYWNCIMSGGKPYSYCGLSESLVCCVIPKGAQPISLFPEVNNRKRQCGNKGRDSGKEDIAELGEWPWHAAILEKQEDLYVCGASLLDESWVLTAAHCVDDYISRAGSLKIRLGEYDVSTNKESLSHTENDVEIIIIYPEFDNSTLSHDIALLKIKNPAKKQPNIDVVCLPKLESIFTDSATKNIKCVITGWGRATEDSEHSLVLKEISIPLWRNSDCEKALQQQFGPKYFLPETSICAGAEGRDACDGDGGGPLVCQKNGHWYQVGIISFGIGCGRKGTPGVYTRVAMYESWIRNTIFEYKSEIV